VVQFAQRMLGVKGKTGKGTADSAITVLQFYETVP
jgi:hypothetical protein